MTLYFELLLLALRVSHDSQHLYPSDKTIDMCSTLMAMMVIGTVWQMLTCHCDSDCTFLEEMAAAEASEPAKEFLECGLCFENDELKRLPCNPDHIYCITCLTKDSERTKIIKCPQCRFVACVPATS